MNLRSVYILFGVLVAVLVVFGLLELAGTKGGAEGKWVLPELHEKGSEVKAGDVERVVLSRYDPGMDQREEIAFIRKDGEWRMAQPHDLRVNTATVDSLVSQVIQARPDDVKEVSHNLKEIGLSPPHLEVTLHKGEQSWKLSASRPSSEKGGGTVYVTGGADPKTPLVVRYNDLDNLFKKSYHDYRARDLVSASTFTTSAVSLAGAKGEEVALEKNAEGQWRFKKPAYGPADFEGDAASPAPGVTATKGVSGVRDLLDAVTGLQLGPDNADFVAEGVPPADLASKYGLDAAKPESLRVAVTSSRLGSGDDNKKRETTDVLLVGKKVGAKDSERKDPKKEAEKKDDKDAKKDDKKDDKTEYYFARLESEPAVVRLPAAKFDKLFEALGSPDRLRDRGLVQADGTRLNKHDALDLKNSSGHVRLRKADGADWKLYRDGAAQPTEPGSVRDLVDALTKKKEVKTFVDKEDGLDFDKPAAVVSFWFEGIVKEEKKEDEKKDGDKKDADKKDGDKKDEKKEEKKPEPSGPKVKEKADVVLTFGKRDRDKGIVYVRREAGEDKTVVTVADALLDKVTVGPLAFAERKLPTFSEGFEHAKDVTKLTLARGSATYEIVKEKSGDKAAWKFATPEAVKGRNASEAAVNNALRDLATLRPERLVAEKPPEGELDTLYGLKTPATKATVTVTKDGKAEDWVYLFGKEADGGKNLYAKQGNRDVVFVVPKMTVETVLSGDLRDPIVMSFAMDKVKAVKLSGWKEVTGVVTVLELERKGEKKWEVKAPAGFNLDQDIAETFVLGLSNLRADRFVTPKAGAKTALDPAEGGLKVEVTVEGEAKPLELAVGAEDPDVKNFYYASGSRLPGDVFLLPKFTFDKAKEKLAYFVKK